jgi:hypothetical protein
MPDVQRKTEIVIMDSFVGIVSSLSHKLGACLSYKLKILHLLFFYCTHHTPKMIETQGCTALSMLSCDANRGSSRMFLIVVDNATTPTNELVSRVLAFERTKQIMKTNKKEKRRVGSIGKAIEVAKADILSKQGGTRMLRGHSSGSLFGTNSKGKPRVCLGGATTCTRKKPTVDNIWSPIFFRQ